MVNDYIEKNLKTYEDFHVTAPENEPYFATHNHSYKPVNSLTGFFYFLYT